MLKYYKYISKDISIRYYKIISLCMMLTVLPTLVSMINTILLKNNMYRNSYIDNVFSIICIVMGIFTILYLEKVENKFDKIMFYSLISMFVGYMILIMNVTFLKPLAELNLITLSGLIISVYFFELSGMFFIKKLKVPFIIFYIFAFVISIITGFNIL